MIKEAKKKWNTYKYNKAKTMLVNIPLLYTWCDWHSENEKFAVCYNSDCSCMIMNNIPLKIIICTKNATTSNWYFCGWLQLIFVENRCWIDCVTWCGFDCAKRTAAHNMNMTLWYIESAVESTALIDSSKSPILEEQTYQEFVRQKKIDFSHKNVTKTR